MSETDKTSLHKEFELERMILFSDAVFAIAITLLIIEVKFPELPENYNSSPNLLKLFKPTILQFVAFLVSFFFIGVSWVKHLKMFRYLKKYDDRLVIQNLVSLFFIVAFPLSASGVIHFKPDFAFPMVIYLANIMLVMLSNFLVAHHIFKRNAHLCFPGNEIEKIYIYKQSLYPAVTLTTVFIIVVSTAIITNNNAKYVAFSTYSLFICLFIMKRKIKKYKPKKEVTGS